MAGIKHPSSEDGTAEPSPPVSPVVAMFQTFRNELDEHHDRRERIIKASRDITALSKKMIFSLQRVRHLQAPLPPAVARELSSYHAKTTHLFASVAAADLHGLNAWRYQSHISPAIQEYLEAVSFRHYVETQRLMPYVEARKEMMAMGGAGVLLLTEEDYVLGVFDLVGELMRFAITSVAMDGALPRGSGAGGADDGGGGGGRDILTDLRLLRAGLDGLDGAGRRAERKVDVMRACVEKVEGAAYGMIVRGRERPKGWVMDVEERRGQVEGY